ncbi:MAG: hypothetical protein M9894_37985 [Planctomycetes bacterium]|nr:hypothetical protein [Planctomycetota bacterium]
MTLTARAYGGSKQLSVTCESDLAAIDRLDPARWAATSVPIADLQCDPVFLKAVDAQGKGRVRVADVIAARDWAFARLADRRDVGRKSDVLALASLDTAQEPGRLLRKAAEHVLAQVGSPGADRLSLAQVRTFMAGYAGTLANGDGVVCPGLLPEPEAAAYVKDVLAVLPGAKDASGQQGIGTADLARFLEGAEAWLAWRRRGEAFDEEARAAAALVDGLAPKVDAFFLLCDLARHQGAPPEAPKLEGEPDAAAIERHLALAPLAPPDPAGALRLDDGVNPAYRERLDALRAGAGRVLGAAPGELTRATWAQVRAAFDDLRAWQASRPPEPFERLDVERLKAMLTSPTIERVRHFIALDAAAAGEVAQVQALERLVLHQRWLLELAANVVNFSALYHPERRALVERGSLVIDGRRLELCVKVDDRAAHKKVAADSLIFLVYAAVSGRTGEAPFEVAAPVTTGERGRLRPGKRGLFVDTAGREWDAVVVDLVENPISVREAVLAPFRRVAAFVSKKVEDLAGSKLASAESSTQGQLGDKVDGLPEAAPAPAPAAPQPSAFQNTLLVGSVAVAALGSATAYVASAVAKISPLELVGGLASVVGLIAALSGFLGWLKLRRRDLGLLLEANGWAVNVPLRVTRRAASLFTRTPPFPPGTRRDLREERLPDDFDEATLAAARRRRRRRVALVVALALVGAAVTWLAWSPDHRARARRWLDRGRALVGGEVAPVTSR